MVECQLPKLNVAGSIPVPRFKTSRSVNVLLLTALVAVAGCATVEKPVKKAELPITAPAAVAAGKGVYHKVKPGETIWRIAKTYGVEVEAIVKSNNIPNVALIEKDQLLMIPGAAAAREVVLPTEKDKPSPDTGEFIWPVKGKVIAYFNQRTGSRVNRGISIAAQEGETVHAARSGKVVFADYLPGYAFTVILDHEDNFFSVYGENAKLLVKTGDQVQQNDPLAQVGRTGDLAYLHFEIRKNANADNPLYYLP